MPNIVITEGLDTPWTLANTESNITAATDLTSINLANQTVGTLAYTASQLFASLKTEKNNLDNIVDAIELINEEIALWPERIAKWDGISDTFEKTNLSPIPMPIGHRVIGLTDSLNNTDFSAATPFPFGLLPGPREPTYSISVNETTNNLNYIKSVTTLINTKPLLDSVGYAFPVESKSYLLLVPGNTDETLLGPVWTVPERVRVEPVEFSSIRPFDLLVTVNDYNEPISFKYYGYYERYDVPFSQAIPFYAPRNAEEKTSMQLALNSALAIAATEALKNPTGLPSGVTPPVTTLGPSVEKYYNKARYDMTEYTTDGISTPVGTLNVGVTMFGDYPPIQDANFGSRIITTADVGKFFQNAGGTIFYVDRQGTGGQFVVREALGTTTPYIASMPDDLKKTLRGEYAEKQILLTQRGTDQTLFVTSITQRYTTFSDMATNLLKTLVNFYNDLARNLRG
jgi:hypothetical protein